MTEDGFFSKFSIITHKKRFVSFIDRKKGGKEENPTEKRTKLARSDSEKSSIFPLYFPKEEKCFQLSSETYICKTCCSSLYRGFFTFSKISFAQ